MPALAIEARKNVAGWSSPVARQAHNLKVVGSNPTPATKKALKFNSLAKSPSRQIGAFCCFGSRQLEAKIPCMTIERIVAAKTIGGL